MNRDDFSEQSRVYFIRVIVSVLIECKGNCADIVFERFVVLKCV